MWKIGGLLDLASAEIPGRCVIFGSDRLPETENTRYVNARRP